MKTTKVFTTTGFGCSPPARAIANNHLRAFQQENRGISERIRQVGLAPDDWLADDVKRPAEPERLAHFAREVLAIVPEDGLPLPVEVERVEGRLRKDRKSPFAGMINPSTRRRVPEPPADKRVLYAELRYPFEARPAALTIVPPIDETTWSRQKNPSCHNTTDSTLPRAGARRRRSIETPADCRKGASTSEMAADAADNTQKTNTLRPQ